MVSPGMTAISDTCAPSTSVIVRLAVSSRAMTRGASGVPGSIGPAASAVVAAAPPIWPLGFRQQAGGGDSPGAGVHWGSRQPRTVTGPSWPGSGVAAPAAWDDGSYSNVMSSLAVIQATSSSTWR